MAVNVLTISGSISSVVKQAMTETLAEKYQQSPSQSRQASTIEQSLADVVSTSLALITQGTLPSTENSLTLALTSVLYSHFHQTIKISPTLSSLDGKPSCPSFTLEPSQPVKKIQPINQWLSAFNIFVAIHSKQKYC